jgi:phosphatidylserine/phosphatidylglycerophosphate/cardiolipin synthase-like enzyme
MRAIEASLLQGSELYREVVLDKLAHARESVDIATANLKDMHIEQRGRFDSALALFSELSARGVALRLLHAELPSRPFRASFEKRRRLTGGGLQLKICPRVHFKSVVVDGAWAYFGSANFTGAGLGAKSEGRRNFELGLCTEDFETIDRISALFQAVWNGAECAACKLRKICPDPIGEEAQRSLVRLGHARRLRVGRRAGWPAY